MERDQRHYVPLLKGRQAEFDALARLGERTRAGMTPLIELVPSAEDDGDQVLADLDRLVDKVVRSWGPVDRVLLDVGRVTPDSLPDETAIGAVAARSRAAGILAVPVLRLTDPTPLVDAVREAHAADGRGACIRVQGDDLQEDPEDLGIWLRSACTDLRLEPDDLDLILDFGAVGDDAVTGLAAGLARQLVRHLPAPGRWRSVTVAAGAFPVDLSGLRPWVLGEVPRRDANLWRSLAATAPSRVPGFGDYGVAHPLLVTGVPFAPPPQLRYAAADRWLILKGHRRDERGTNQFFDICRAISERPEFTPGLGGADDRIEEAARRYGGPGNGTTWRSIGTGHHIDLVVDRLRTTREP